MSGRVEALWVKRAHGGPMDAVDSVQVDEKGIVGNADRGTRRAVSIISADAWADAETDLGTSVDPTLRRPPVH